MVMESEPAWTVASLSSVTAPAASWTDVTLPVASIVLLMVPAPMFAEDNVPEICVALTVPVRLLAVMA